MHQLLKHEGREIAYVKIPGKLPGVVFLGGFMSDMSATKATYIQGICEQLGQAFIRFDYTGHGISSGRFEEGTIGQWRNDAVAVLDNLTAGPQILVGSSMGGWLMILTALERIERIHALIGIASAPDFLEDFERLNEAQKASFEKYGFCHIPSQYGDEPYIITRDLVEEGRNHRVLQAPIIINCPVRLLHGLNDQDVPWQKSIDLSQRLTSNDVTVTLIKDGDHRLSQPMHLKLIGDCLKSLLV